MKRKRYKPSRLGLNWKNIGIYIILPILCFIMFISLLILGKNKLDKYITQKQITESIEESIKLVQESIEESESYERYLKESSISIKKEKYEKMLAEEAEQRRIQLEFENKIFSNYWPHGTYVRNDKTGECGIVDHCLIPYVYTKEGWYFEAYTKTGVEGFHNEEITKIGWKEWNNYSKNIINKKSKEYQNKLNALIQEEGLKRCSEAKKKFPPNPKYGYCKYDGEYYFIHDWTNGVLKLKHRNDSYKDKHFIYINYDDPNIRPLTKKNEHKYFHIKDYNGE